MNILATPIESTNKVMVFTFSFSSEKEGEVVGYDRQLEVSIAAKWFITDHEGEQWIRIDGFDIVKFGEAGLFCKLTDLASELIYLEAAYDLCFGR